MNILFCLLPYPYGDLGIIRRKQIRMSASVDMVAAQLLSLGNTIKIMDFSIDTEESIYECALKWSDLVCLSVIGLPCISIAKEYAQKIKAKTNKQVLVSGQGLLHLSEHEITQIFGDYALHANKQVILDYFGVEELPNPIETSLVPVWQECYTDKRLKLYLSEEITLLGPSFKGCVYDCPFCLIEDKNIPPTFRKKDVFEGEIRFLCQKVNQFNLAELKLYATPLDFFQFPKQVVPYLETMRNVSLETTTKLKARSLLTVHYLYLAINQVPDLGKLLRDSGMRTLAPGVDGNMAIWETVKKQNKSEELTICLEFIKNEGLQGEVLMVFGFPGEKIQSLVRSVVNSFIYALKYRVTLRPYRAKTNAPGTDAWVKFENKQQLLENPELFQMFDFTAFASKEVHPNWVERITANICYLIICFAIPLITFTKFSTFPIFPQWQKGIWGKISRIINYFMPADI